MNSTGPSGRSSQQWLIPEDGPDPTPVERVQAALPYRLSIDIIDSIVCQIRLTVQEDEDFESRQLAFDDDPKPWIWKYETLNIHGRPTVQVSWSATTGAPIDNEFQPQHEIYFVFHTHEYSISGNRPIAIGRLSPTPRPHEFHIQWMASPMNRTATITGGVGMSKRGHISVHIQYSAGIGHIPPPLKQSWLHGGAIQTRYICRNVTTPVAADDVRNDDLFSIMNIKPFASPISTEKLSSFDQVLAYGDSILEQLIASRLCPKHPYACCYCSQIHFLTKVAKPLSSFSLPILLKDLDGLLEPYLNGPDAKSTALILNSALWDVLSDEATMTDTTCSLEGDRYPVWNEHLNAMTQYLRTIAALYPQVRLFWLLPTAVHIHRVHLLSEPLLLQKAPQKIQRTKYMSASRTQQLYHHQRALLASLQKSEDSPSVLGLDIYEATYLSADWTLPGDGRHYRPELNQLMLSWFY
jgi:hypothetical protein